MYTGLLWYSTVLCCAVGGTEYDVSRADKVWSVRPEAIPTIA